MNRIGSGLFGGYVAIAGVVAVGIAVSPLGVSQILGCEAITLSILMLSWFVLQKAARTSGLLSFVGVLLLYLWVGFPLKFAGLINFKELSWIAELPIAGVMDLRVFMAAFLTCLAGIIPFAVGLCIPLRVAPKGEREKEVRYSASIFLWILSLLGLKLFLQVVLGIAKPGVENNAFEIPLVTGLLTFAVGFYLTALINICFFFALLDRSTLKTRLSVAMIVLLVVSDLIVGVKLNLVIEAVLLVYYAWIQGVKIRSRKRMGLLVLSVVALVLAGVLFKYVNYYRYAMISGSDISTSIEFAKRILEQKNESSSVALLNRVNGLDNFVAALTLGQQYRFGLDALWNTQLMDTFNFELYGGDVVATQFGLTQFGALYVTGGVGLLIVGSLLFGICGRALFALFNRKILPSELAMIAFAPLLAFWMMKFLFASGFASLYVKEMCFLVAAMWTTMRFFFQFAPRASARSEYSVPASARP
jgi:hypothetical protein